MGIYSARWPRNHTRPVILCIFTTWCTLMFRVTLSHDLSHLVISIREINYFHLAYFFKSKCHHFVNRFLQNCSRQLVCIKVFEQVRTIHFHNLYCRIQTIYCLLHCLKHLPHVTRPSWWLLCNRTQRMKRMETGSRPHTIII